jgi:hypothetical protein
VVRAGLHRSALAPCPAGRVVVGSRVRWPWPSSRQRRAPCRPAPPIPSRPFERPPLTRSTLPSSPPSSSLAAQHAMSASISSEQYESLIQASLDGPSRTLPRSGFRRPRPLTWGRCPPALSNPQPARAPTRPTRTSESERPSCCRRARSSRAPTSRTPRSVRSGSLPVVRRGPRRFGGPAHRARPKGTRLNDRSSRPPAGGTICAERTALVKAVSENKRKFIAIAVSSWVLSRLPNLRRLGLAEIQPLHPPSPCASALLFRDVEEPVTSPCGICRQFIREFCGPTVGLLSCAPCSVT